MPLGPLLERRLGIARRLDETVHGLLPVAPDEPLGRIEPAVEEERADQRLDAVREDAGIASAARTLFAARQPERLRHRKVAGDPDERAPVDEMGEALAEGSFRIVGKGLDQHAGDAQAEDAVAEELEAFVAGPAGAGGAGVGQGLDEQPPVAEAVAQRLLDGGQSASRVRGPAGRRTATR